MQHPILSKLTSINTFILDVDGVLTNGSVHITETGNLLRSMNIKDGFALQYAIKQGFNIIVITGGKSEGVKLRLEKLGITDVHLGVSDKLACLQEILTAKNVSLDECIYMGDDLPDLEVMKMCGIKSCPSDAVWQIKEIADIVCKAKGGDACVRELIEMVLSTQSKWPAS